MFPPTFRTIGVEVASQAGASEEVVPEICGFGWMRDLFQSVNVHRCMCRVRAILSAESEPSMVDHTGSQGHGRMSYPASLFRVTNAASLIHRFQIAGIFDQANMSGVFVFHFRLAAVALNASNCMFWVHGRVRFVAVDAVTRVLARNTIRYGRRTAPPCGVECLRMCLYPPREGALIEVAGMPVLLHFCPWRRDVGCQDPPQQLSPISKWLQQF